MLNDQPRPLVHPPRRRRALGSGVAVAVAGTLVAQVLLAAPASAHDELLSTDPAAGSTVAVVPDVVTLTFAEPPLSLGMGVEIDGPSGPVAIGAPMLSGSTVRQMLDESAPAGTYTVRWRVTADDGHPVTGSFTFVATAADSASPEAVSASPDASPTATSTTSGNDRGMPSPLLWWGILGAGAVLVVAAATLTLSRRRRAGTDAGHDGGNDVGTDVGTDAGAGADGHDPG